MKKGRFLWSAHRITEKQKAGKARNIKEKQLKNSRNTVSKQLVELLSSQRDNRDYFGLYALSRNWERIFCVFFTVGRWFFAAERIFRYMTVIGCYQIEFNIIP